MFDLDPEKLFIVLIVALVLLGPDKLPKLARQLGSGWAKVRTFQERIEAEVRESMPELPSTHEIARIARSPIHYLNSLADSSEELVPDPAAPASADSSDESWPVDRAAPAATNGSSNGQGPSGATLMPPVAVPGHPIPVDPGMN
jgi:sec-independent protein translocase protein TatB